MYLFILISINKNYISKYLFLNYLMKQNSDNSFFLLKSTKLVRCYTIK